MDCLKARVSMYNAWGVNDITLISENRKANHSLKFGKRLREKRVAMELSGLDSDGKVFKNAEDMWREQIGEEGEPHKKAQWYREGVSYWEVSLLFYFILFFFFWVLSCCTNNLSKSADFEVLFCGFWEKGVEASDDGVLGGFGKVNDVDIKGSEAFLQNLFFERFNNAARTDHLVALGNSIDGVIFVLVD